MVTVLKSKNCQVMNGKTLLIAIIFLVSACSMKPYISGTEIRVFQEKDSLVVVGFPYKYKKGTYKYLMFEKDDLILLDSILKERKNDN